MELYKVSVVSYLNSKLFVHGLENSGLLNNCHLELDTPAVCAEKLITNKVDIGLIPVAVIPLLKYSEILTNYCIGTDGIVDSVVLYSEVPLKKIEKILLDYQSKTSVTLVKILAKKYWKIQPQFVSATKGYEETIDNTLAGVVIGDRTFSLKGKYKYTYDLANEWKKYTGLPFVFACWVANKELSQDFKNKFNEAVRYGIDNKANILHLLQKDYPQIDVNDYLTNKISYNFDDKKKQALSLFLNYLKEF